MGRCHKGRRMTRIASRKYIDGSRGRPCKLRIAGICTGGGEDTVFAHIRDQHTGRSIKASDVSGADACRACHAKFDGHAGDPLSQEDWLFYAVRGLQETLEDRIRRGIVIVPLDPEQLSHDKPAPKRKPPEQRRAIPKGKPMESRSDWPAKGTRPLRSRNMKERGI